MPAFALIAGLLGLVGLAIYGKLSSTSSGDDNGGLLGVLGMTITTAPTNAGASDDPVTIALPLIENFEGFVANAYEDPSGSGKYSIGYGHQIRPGDPYDAASTISQSEAEDVLRVDVGAAWTCVYNAVPQTCTPQQYAALISLCFNIGCDAFKNSTLVKDLNNGDADSAAAQFLVWDKETVNGQLQTSDALASRRQQEQTLFQSGASA